jgi:hypothetical protein
MPDFGIALYIFCAWVSVSRLQSSKLQESRATNGVTTETVADRYVNSRGRPVNHHCQSDTNNVILDDQKNDTRRSTWYELLKHLVQRLPNPPTFSWNERCLIIIDLFP